MSASEPEANGSSLQTRLQVVSSELRELEQLVKSGEFDPRVLRDFRDAVDHVRATAWAVQQWIGLRKKAGDPYVILPALAAERVRSVTQLAKDLVLDLEAAEVGVETEGLPELVLAVEDLHRCLSHLFKG